MGLFGDTLPENQNWMIQMRGVGLDGLFQGHTVRKHKLDFKRFFKRFGCKKFKNCKGR